MRLPQGLQTAGPAAGRDTGGVDVAAIFAMRLRIFSRAQVWTLRERFLKLSTRVMLSVRRMPCICHIHFSICQPSGT